MRTETASLVPHSPGGIRIRAGVLLATAALLLAACSPQESDARAADPSDAAPVAPLQDVGKIEHVHVTAEGTGITADDAMQDALRLAIMEVNGEPIDAVSAGVKFGLDLPFLKKFKSLGGAAFAQAMATRTRGVISSFKLLGIDEPTFIHHHYKARIEAAIARFSAPADARKIKIVLSPLHVPAATFDVGGIAFPAAKIAGEVRQRLMDALTATGRFSVLDREFGPEVQSELDLIASGETRSDEMAKLHQTLSADVVWIGVINDFGYHKSARHLRMADRDLVSYAGGWSLSHRVLNVSTRQILLSDTLHNPLPPSRPTTLDGGVDSAQIAATMELQAVEQTVAAILSRTFPVVVVSLDGDDVILSQGGRAVKVGARYAVVSMGEKLKDPQTGESLGYAEAACCDVLIRRVSNKLAYGHLENVRISLEAIGPAGLQIREELTDHPPVDTPATGDSRQSQASGDTAPAQAAAAAPKARPARPRAPAPRARPAGDKNSDDKKW